MYYVLEPLYQNIFIAYLILNLILWVILTVDYFHCLYCFGWFKSNINEKLSWLQQGPIVDLAPSGSHLCGFRQPVPSQNLLKTFIGNGEGDCSATEKSVSHVESYHCGFKRGGLIEDAELSSPKKRKLSVSGEFFTAGLVQLKLTNLQTVWL